MDDLKRRLAQYNRERNAKLGAVRRLYRKYAEADKRRWTTYEVYDQSAMALYKWDHEQQDALTELAKRRGVAKVEQDGVVLELVHTTFYQLTDKDGHRLSDLSGRSE